MRMLFIHRSVGQQLIDAGRLRSTSPVLDIYDLNANTNVTTDGHGRELTDSPLAVEGGNTNPDGLERFFNQVSGSEIMGDFVQQFDIIAFKSCYSASALPTDEELGEQCAAYEGGIGAYIKDHPEQTFIIVTPPPRRPLLTKPENARRATEFAEWLSGFSSRRPNCDYFDLHATLAESSVLRRSYRRLAPYDQHPNDIGARDAALAFASVLDAVVQRHLSS